MEHKIEKDAEDEWLQSLEQYEEKNRASRKEINTQSMTSVFEQELLDFEETIDALQDVLKSVNASKNCAEDIFENGVAHIEVFERIEARLTKLDFAMTDKHQRRVYLGLEQLLQIINTHSAIFAASSSWSQIMSMISSATRFGQVKLGQVHFQPANAYEEEVMAPAQGTLRVPKAVQSTEPSHRYLEHRTATAQRTKNPKLNGDKLEIKKYDPKVRKHVVYKEEKMK